MNVFPKLCTASVRDYTEFDRNPMLSVKPGIGGTIMQHEIPRVSVQIFSHQISKKRSKCSVQKRTRIEYKVGNKENS
jgi:hypothetical protein